MSEALVIGLSLGCIYGFVAMGFALIYRTTGIMNFAQGAFVMLGGMGAGYAGQEWGLPLPVAALIGIGFAVLAGLLLVTGVVLPLWRRGASEFISSDSTLNRNGVRMGSADIYAAVETIPEIAEALVIGAEQADGSYWMPLFVVLKDGVALDDALVGRTRTASASSPRRGTSRTR